MLELLDRKIRQMHEALEGLATSDLSSAVPQGGNTPDGYCWAIDFSQGCTDARLANVTSLLIANIACLKDHLKAWCTTNGKRFEGDRLIDADRNVAIIHDLWNLDKHAALNRPPRSGHRPKLKNLDRQLAVSSGTAPQSYALFTFDPSTGQMKAETSGTGSVTLTVRPRAGFREIAGMGFHGGCSRV